RDAIREYLFAIGEDPDREGLRDTPDRVARAATQLYAGLSQDAATALSARFSIDHDELIIVRDIEIFSTCEHHLLPFHGVAHVGYIPSTDGTVTGLSKVDRKSTRLNSSHVKSSYAVFCLKKKTKKPKTTT